VDIQLIHREFWKRMAIPNSRLAFHLRSGRCNPDWDCGLAKVAINKNESSPRAMRIAGQ
jgi:hypothetical protein